MESLWIHVTSGTTPLSLSSLGSALLGPLTLVIDRLVLSLFHLILEQSPSPNQLLRSHPSAQTLFFWKAMVATPSSAFTLIQGPLLP